MLQLVYGLYEEHGEYDEYEEDVLLIHKYPKCHKEVIILTRDIELAF